MNFGLFRMLSEDSVTVGIRNLDTRATVGVTLNHEQVCALAGELMAWIEHQAEKKQDANPKGNPRKEGE